MTVENGTVLQVPTYNQTGRAVDGNRRRSAGVSLPVRVEYFRCFLDKCSDLGSRQFSGVAILCLSLGLRSRMRSELYELSQW